jgi:hypothetical protein
MRGFPRLKYQNLIQVRFKEQLKTDLGMELSVTRGTEMLPGLEFF